MEKYKCIYCLKIKEINLFDREHVIPQSFGRFKPNNLTLINSVCKQCNSYFGNELDLFLARDTLDGLMRYRYGLKPFTESDSTRFKRKRVRFKLAEKGAWEGTLLELCLPQQEKKSFSDKALIPQADIVLIPQAAFYKENSKEKVHVPLEKITSKEDLKKQGFDLRKGCLLIAPSDKEMSKVMTKIKDIGLETTIKKYNSNDNSKPVKGQLLKVQVESTIDKIIFRSIAKISFNYLAKTTGKEFVLLSDFNEVRNYIRYGKQGEKNFVIIINKPITSNNTFCRKQKDGHLIAIDWGDNLNLSIVGTVSLFNRLTYKILLCRYFNGIIREIRSGHYFDIHTKRISKF